MKKEKRKPKKYHVKNIMLKMITLLCVPGYMASIFLINVNMYISYAVAVFCLLWISLFFVVNFDYYFVITLYFVKKIPVRKLKALLKKVVK